jgi:hypothetical protein
MIFLGLFFILLFFLLLLILFLVLPLIFYKKINDNIKLNCNINPYNNIIGRGNGFLIVDNILDEKCRKTIVKSFLEEARYNKNLNEDKKLYFYSNKKFLHELSNLVGEQLYPVNSLDLQRCWLRYYFEGMKAQYYENYHHDIKRYNSTIKQYRLIIPIYDTSDSKFIIKNYGEFPFTQNMGVFLEADNCLHKVNFSKGERLLLIMDFITKDCDSLYNHYKCRSINSYYNWIKDVIWRKLSSVYYKLVN